MFYVYVVELRDRRIDPDGRTIVYVGSSAYRPSLRFLLHKQGERGSRHVRRYGLRLRPDLYAHLPPFDTRAEARKEEGRLASRLERRGFVVYGACRRSEVPECVIS